MGLLILPFIFAAFVVTIISFVLIIKQVRNKQIEFKQFPLGFIISLAIYGVIIICFKIAGSAWALSPAFITPICLFIIPFGLYFILKSQNNKILPTTLLISIVVSGILSTVFYEAYFDFFDYIGIERIY